jgi:predicted ABC-type ATPase
MKNHLKTIIRSLILEAMRELAPGQKPKMIFLAGGAGSGKSTILRALDVRSKGFEVIDPDEAFEEGLRQNKFDMNVGKSEKEFFDISDRYKAAQEAGDEETMKQLQPEYDRVKKQASVRGTLFMAALHGSKEKALGLAKEQHDFIVDGTGGNYDNIANLDKKFKELGYDTAMIFVHVELETSLQRNRSRGEQGGRSLRDSTVKRNWENVHKNEEAYRNLFGNNFFYIDAGNLESSFGQVVPSIIRFMK